MAGHRALSAAAVSVVSLLNREIERLAQPAPRPTALLVGPGAAHISPPGTGASILVHPCRVLLDPVGGPGRNTGLPRRLDAGTEPERGTAMRLHLAIGVSAEDPETELAALGLAIMVLQATPVLGGELLDPTGDWGPGEQVRLVPVAVDGSELTDVFAPLGLAARPAVVYEMGSIVIHG